MTMNVNGGGTQGQNFFSSLFGANAVQNPNADAYNQLSNQAAGQASAYGSGAIGYSQQGATINNGQQNAELNQYGQAQQGLGQMAALAAQTAQGQGPAATAAQNQMTQATGQNIAAQMAMARSANGGALAQNGAQLAAQGNIANTLGQAASQSEQNLANQELQAQQNAAQIYGQQGQLTNAQMGILSQQAAYQAQLQQQNQAQINSQRYNLGQLSLGAQGQALQTQNAYNNQTLAAEGLSNTENQQGLSNFGQLAGAAASGAVGAGLV